MGKYFVCDTHLTGLKQKMMLPPNRGYMVSVFMVTGISPASCSSLVAKTESDRMNSLPDGPAAVFPRSTTHILFEYP